MKVRMRSSGLYRVAVGLPVAFRRGPDTVSRQLFRYSATEAVAAIRSGAITAEALVTSCLERIEERERAVGAWAFLEPQAALAEARTRDREDAGRTLAGVPVGLKDIIDTDFMPTACGSPLLRDHRPAVNAVCVERLRAAGAVLPGKTVTTEFAYMHPGKTRNPHDPDHTPGGSSSGSAAAVADCHVPLALGTQTAGSIIRPASYCGVVGYKPTFDSFSCEGIHAFAPSLDTLGGFSRSVADMVLLRNALSGKERKVRESKPGKVALVRGPYWEQAEAETRSLLDDVPHWLELADTRIDAPVLDKVFEGINAAQRDIQLGECVESLKKYYLRDRNGFSPQLLADYEYGMQLSKQAMKDAYARVALCRQAITQLFTGCDLVLTAASPGCAPRGLVRTGDPVFNRMWTALGLPCLSLPCPRPEGGLPLGLQLVGPHKGDERLLAQALWLEGILADYSASR